MPFVDVTLHFANNLNGKEKPWPLNAYEKGRNG